MMSPSNRGLSCPSTPVKTIGNQILNQEIKEIFPTGICRDALEIFGQTRYQSMLALKL